MSDRRWDTMERPLAKPHMWLNMKNSELCGDIHCLCGETMHFDGRHLYFLRCPVCGRAYRVGQYLRLLPITSEEVERWGVGPQLVTFVREPTASGNCGGPDDDATGVCEE